MELLLLRGASSKRKKKQQNKTNNFTDRIATAKIVFIPCSIRQVQCLSPCSVVFSVPSTVFAK